MVDPGSCGVATDEVGGSNQNWQQAQSVSGNGDRGRQIERKRKKGQQRIKGGGKRARDAGEIN